MTWRMIILQGYWWLTHISHKIHVDYGMELPGTPDSSSIEGCLVADPNIVFLMKTKNK